MKTRVISTEIWDEDKVFCLNIDTKLLYLVLLTNPYIGQSRFYKINDRQLSTYSGLNVEQIQKCKRDLEEQNMVFFKGGYVCVTGFGFVECFYKGSKNEVAKIKELEKIPEEVLSFFTKKLDTLSIPYTYPSDTTINLKSEIINNKLEINGPSTDSELPPWLNIKAWDAWLQYRKEKKKPVTPTSRKLQLRFLEDNKSDHTQIIKNSILNGWTGLFPLNAAKSKKIDYAQENRERKENEQSNDRLREISAQAKELSGKMKI